MLMQFVPSAPQKANAAIHFALLDVCHITKMEGHVSNHAMANIINQIRDDVIITLLKWRTHVSKNLNRTSP